MTRTLAIVFIALTLTNCGQPWLYFPGERLSGEERPFTGVPANASVIQIETLPSDPYSVNIGFVEIDGMVYIDPAADRQWYMNIQQDSAVRLKFVGTEVVHPMVAVPVSDAQILSQFDPERIILRLDPR